MQCSIIWRVSNYEPRKSAYQLDVKEMNKEKHQTKGDHAEGFSEQDFGTPNFYPSRNGSGNTLMTGFISGQSMPFLKNSETEIRTKIFRSDLEFKSKSEPKIYEDFDF